MLRRGPSARPDPLLKQGKEYQTPSPARSMIENFYFFCGAAALQRPFNGGTENFVCNVPKINLLDMLGPLAPWRPLNFIHLR